MRHGCSHIQVLERRLFAGNDNVDVVAALQTVVHDGQQAIRVRRKIDSHNIGFLVHDMIDKTRILMAEPVMILPPDM